MATLAFSGTGHEVIHLLKAFEIGFDRKSDAKMITFIGILSIPGALFAPKYFIVEFTLSGVSLSIKKDEISIWVLVSAFCQILTILG